MLEQKKGINRIPSDDRKANVNITWQDKDVLQLVNNMLKPLSKFIDILSGENYIIVSSLLPVLHLINEDTSPQNICCIASECQLHHSTNHSPN